MENKEKQGKHEITPEDEQIWMGVFQGFQQRASRQNRLPTEMVDFHQFVSEGMPVSVLVIPILNDYDINLPDTISITITVQGMLIGVATAQATIDEDSQYTKVTRADYLFRQDFGVTEEAVKHVVGVVGFGMGTDTPQSSTMM